MQIKVKVHPHKPKTLVRTQQTRADIALEVDLAARPEANEANIELQKLLAKHFNTLTSNVIIKSGHKSRIKIVEVNI